MHTAVLTVYGKTNEGSRITPVSEQHVLQRVHEAVIKKWEVHWRSVGERKKWNTIVSPSEVYDHCGEALKEDPRLKTEYRDQVLTKLGLNKFGLDTANEALKDA